MEENNEDKVAVKTGKSRLGYGNILENLGPTMIICSIVFIGIVFLLYIFYLVSRV